MNKLLGPTKILGGILIAFGALQAMLPQLKDSLSPTSYAWVALFIGVVVTILGRLKQSDGGFLWANKTTIVGVLLIVASAFQGFSDTVRELVDPAFFNIFTVVLGVAVAVLGFLNSSGDPPPPAE